LFFDDNPINVEAAENYGLRSELTLGIAAVKESLQKHGVLS
jgi:hypothetical protein